MSAVAHRFHVSLEQIAIMHPSLFKSCAPPELSDLSRDHTHLSSTVPNTFQQKTFAFLSKTYSFSFHCLSLIWIAMSFVFFLSFSEETHTESLSIECFILLIPLSVLLVFDLLIFVFPLVESWSLLKLMHVYKLAHCRTLYSQFFQFWFHAALLCP